MPSVVIAAHNEERVLGPVLDAVLRQDVVDWDVIVVANGCTDRTAQVADRPGVTVVDRPEPGKAGALNAGDAIATGFPRIYLDADIVVPEGGLAAILERFSENPAALVVVPRRRLDIGGRPWPVRAYFTINERLPAFRRGLFGRGTIAVSEAGRARFTTFPALIADDLFLDSQFTDGEKVEAGDVEVVVETPFTTRDLLRRLVRVRRGNAQLRAAAASGQVDVQVRPSDRWAWLRDVVLPAPRLAFAAIPYLAITVTAALLARRAAKAGAWGRDESTRGRAGSPVEGTQS
ncbi:glycosyltransferase [Agromyces badenianii]|uniref:4,4'-diaponeurosporenoate glycosyltransferase n=1 Tax=Agromyces badenianii TaxID=2080742 RepID=A0A2S0WY65_9MICO|nr:glycosyltransferase family 2 protein [Agromyces badenianii]AWB96297.1 glycosyltransferase [Agromyces badenianii]